MSSLQGLRFTMGGLIWVPCVLCYELVEANKEVYCGCDKWEHGSEGWFYCSAYCMSQDKHTYKPTDGVST